MNKIYDIIYLNDNDVLVVDREETNYDKVGWWCFMDKFIGGTCVIDKETIQFRDHPDQGIHTLYTVVNDQRFLSKIIASSKHITGSKVPLFKMDNHEKFSKVELKIKPLYERLDYDDADDPTGYTPEIEDGYVLINKFIK